MTPEVGEYLLKVGMREHPVLAELRATTKNHAQAQMQSAPEQGQLLAMFVRLLAARRTLDIGTFTGYSALSVALATPDDGVTIACDVNKHDTDIALPFWERAGVNHKIDLRIGPALHTLDALIKTGQSGTFDLTYIDADKGNYIHYYERSLELLRPGGLVTIDNTLWSGRVTESDPELSSTQKIQAFNQHVHADDRVEMVLLPIGDGLTVATKN